MKNINKILTIFLGSLIFFLLSCNEEEFLKEENPGQLVADNAYITESDFQSAMWTLYANVRNEFYSGDQRKCRDYQAGTDLCHPTETQTNDFFTYYSVCLDPAGGVPWWHWNNLYKLIANANTIISRLPNAEFGDDVKLRFEAEARFFRGYAYRVLAGLYGGVPLVLEEIKGPKKDFTRAAQEEVYQQVIEDLKFAAENLPSIAEVNDAQVSDIAAYHALSEAYLCVNDFSKAEQAASKVIDDPNMALMTSRFGTLANEPGDVYWDLFRRGNQNRSTGNTEAIWVIQLESDVPGGATNGSNCFKGGCTLERVFAPLLRSKTKVMNQETHELELDSEGNPIQSQNIWPASDFTGGRGIGWLAPTEYAISSVWENETGKIDYNDIRTSNFNIPRKIAYNNPEMPWYNDTLYIESPQQLYPFVGIVESFGAVDEDVYKSKNLWPRGGYPYWTKVTTPGQHPETLWAPSYPLNKALKGTAGNTYRDFYMFRLAETYLLRAEARLRGGDAAGAADDINVIRNRANASAVTAGDMSIDFILDERVRELNIEEKRRLTLARLGVLVERTKQYNPYHADNTFNSEILEHNKLFPIPISFIQDNTDNVIEQNPGY